MSSDKTKYSARTTAEAVATDFADRIAGKHVLITGGNIGLGLETARVLASKGAIVTIACRSRKNGEEAVATIKSKHPDAKISNMTLDLASLKSIKSFVDTFLAKNEPLNILINNAGIMACPLGHTADGFETQFGVNHVGHFYLTHLLIDKLAESAKRWAKPDDPSRVVNLSSVANYFFAPEQGIFLDDINGEKSYNPWDRYGQSKLANILFTRELNKRVANRNVISVSVHPGVITSTGLYGYVGLKSTVQSMIAIRKGTIMTALNGEVKTIPEGSATTILAALDPAIIPAEHYSDCHLEHVEVHPKASDEELGLKLWELTESLIKSRSI